MKTPSPITRHSSFVTRHPSLGRLLPGCSAFAVLGLVLFAGRVTADVPAGYNAICYIEGTGTQWIDTGYVPNPTTRTLIDFQFTDVVKQYRVFGLEAGNLYYSIYENGNGNWAYTCHNASGSWNQISPATACDTSRHTFDFNFADVNAKRCLTIDGGDTASVTGLLGTRNKNGSYTLALGAARNASSAVNISKHRIYLCRMYEGDDLVREFVPAVRVSDNVAGLYDMVEGVFHESAGSAAYVAGGAAVFTAIEVRSATDDRFEGDPGMSPALGHTVVSADGGTAIFSAPSGVILSPVFRQARVTGGTLYAVANGVETAVATTSSTTLSYAVGDPTVSLRMVWDVVFEDRSGIFVTPTGAGLKDGSSWANALEGWDAIAGAATAGARICLAVGDYPVSAQFAPSSLPALMIQGGFAGTDDAAPYARAATGETRLAVPSGVVSRHILASGMRLVLRDLVFTGGNTASKAYGSGLHLTTCQTTISNCVFHSNGKTESTAQARLYGSAIHVTGGSLDIRGSLFSNNYYTATADNVWLYGGALYASGTDLSIADTTFDANRVNNTIKPCMGGAIYLTGGRTSIDNCTFTTNTLYGNHAGNTHCGAAIYAVGVNALDIRDSYFAGNVTKCRPQISGGLISLAGATSATTMRLQRCVFKANGPSSDNNGMCASISLGEGELEMEQCLFTELSLPRSGSFKRVIDVQKGTLRANRCTFAANAAAGIFCHAELGRVILRNSIVYGNTEGDLTNFNTDGSNFNVSYSCLGTDYGYGWTGIVTDDPLLSADGFYHPLSAGGRLADGYFSGMVWTTDASTSPTLDAGDPAADWFDEPQPNNLRMNIGYDANTPAASKSATGAYAHFDSLAVVALPATNVTDSSAWARGIVGGLGNGGNASVTLVWDTADRGTAATGDWAHAVPLGAFGQWDHLAAVLTGLSAGQAYHYRFFASNASGTAWSDDASFAIPTAPVLSVASVSHLSRHSANLCATLVSAGGSACGTTVSYWPSASPSAVTTFTVDTPAEGVLARIPVSGLTAVTAYDFRITVDNPAGTVSQSGSFTTLATTTPIMRYVTPEGAGIQDGSSWENAYAGLLPALDECLYAGDTIYMKHGTYDEFRVYTSGELTQIILSNLGGLSIYGGYAGVGTPGDLAESPTVIARNTSNSKRHFRIASSRLHLENITFSDGLWRSGSEGGGSLYLTSCTTAITNCVFTGNRVNYTAGNGNAIADGGAIFASGGSLDLYDCTFTNNANYLSGECRTRGGAVSATSCTLLATKCRFFGNYAYDSGGHVAGGALYVNGGGRADVGECEFRYNWCNGAQTSRVLAMGGALAVRNVGRFAMTDTCFVGNFAGDSNGRGGSAFFDGNATMTAAVARCVFDLNGTNLVPAAKSPSLGSVHLDSASLFMTNCLFSRTAKTAAITSENITTFKDINNGNGYSAPRVLELVNVTIADSAGYGVDIAGDDATVRIRNGIVWGNASGGVNKATEVAYTCSQEALDGVGNFVADPLLAPPFYHLTSRAKYIADGWFGGTFVTPAKCASSPCIDAGDPASDYSAEPKPHGKAVNLGAYGGTPWASVTWTPPGLFVILQ